MDVHDYGLVLGSHGVDGGRLTAAANGSLIQM